MIPLEILYGSNLNKFALENSSTKWVPRMMCQTFAIMEGSVSYIQKNRVTQIDSKVGVIVKSN